MLTIAPNMFPGFQGLYYQFLGEEGMYSYVINNIVYNAEDFYRSIFYDPNITIEQFQRNAIVFPSFNIDPNGSQILAVNVNSNIMLYQQLEDDTFIKLLENSEIYDDPNYRFVDVRILRVPGPNNQEISLKWFNSPFITILSYVENANTQEEILRILNSNRTFISVGDPPTENYLQQCNLLPEQIYEMLKSVYVKLPEYLIINGLKVNFMSFQQISDMLIQNQIERYIIDPILQPLVQPPYSILTFFNKNGITYLSKVKYDQVNNRILP